MEKLAYTMGAQHACEVLGLKTAAPVSGIYSGPSMMGRNSSTQSKPFGWGLGGKPPEGFTNRDPASIQSGAAPGGPPQLNAAPIATPATQPGPSPMTGSPIPNAPITAPSASGITGAIESKNMPSAGTGTSLGIPSGGNAKSLGISGGGDPTK